MVLMKLRWKTSMEGCRAAMYRRWRCHTTRASGNSMSQVGLMAAMAVLSPLTVVRADSDTKLDEVVVTAQRQSERSHDVPIALTAVSADELHDRGIRQAADITALVPNLLVN